MLKNFVCKILALLCLVLSTVCPCLLCKLQKLDSKMIKLCRRPLEESELKNGGLKSHFSFTFCMACVMKF